MINPKLIAAAISYVAVFSSGYLICGSKYKAKEIEFKAQVEAAKAQQIQVTEQVRTEYITKIEQVKIKGDTIIKEIPKYVKNNNCTINNGFVILHNAAASNTLPQASGGIDEEAKGVGLDTVAEVNAENYKRYHDTVTQLESLQEWVNKQSLTN